jgi:centrosomal protein CEP290
MPDPNLPVSGQLDQAMDIIRSHIKLLAEAKVQADLSKKRIQDLETHNRKLESEVTIRDKVITELRLRLPASSDRDAIIKSMMASSASSGGEMSSNNAPVKAAQATIESLQVEENLKRNF